MSKLPGLLFCSFMILAGTVLFYGTYRRWWMLVNPSSKLRFLYSQSAIRTYLGERAVIFFTYLLGVSFIPGGALVLWNGLR
jgi:hypothetical protein